MKEQSEQSNNRSLLETEQKALEINLDEKIYGTFAEIGAGQEVARYFFKVGSASGTIAKTMSAYDKTYSDDIYGTEQSGRYVCESRLYKMLDHEYELMQKRLKKKRPDSKFFVFADTVAAINYQRTIQGHGWLGVRFQLHPDGEPNDFVIHARMMDNDNQLQQEAIGELGVNMVYACFFYSDNVDQFVQSLNDGLAGRVRIDMACLSGPDFKQFDNRLLSLKLVQHDLTEVAMFGPDGRPVHPSEFMYKKSVMVVRGNYRPPTVVSLDVFDSAFKMFCEEEPVNPDEAELLAEITLQNLSEETNIDEDDFLSRADCLCALGKTTIISNCEHHQVLINYLSEYKIKQLGLVIGARELLALIEGKYEQNKEGRLLVAFGELFTKNIRVYAYPALDDKTGDLMTINNLPVPEGIKFLYKHLIDSQYIVDVKGVREDLLHIMPHDIYHMIQSGEEGWEDAVPPEIARIIEEKQLFGYVLQSEKSEV